MENGPCRHRQELPPPHPSHRERSTIQRSNPLHQWRPIRLPPTQRSQPHPKTLPPSPIQHHPPSRPLAPRRSPRRIPENCHKLSTLTINKTSFSVLSDIKG